MLSPTAEAWFFIVHLPAEIEESICFGDEGQRWTLMDIDDVMNILNWCQLCARDLGCGCRTRIPNLSSTRVDNLLLCIEGKHRGH